MKKNKIQCAVKTIGTGIGVGIIAGFAGTVAVTLSQMIEMRITNRKAGTGPANAVEKTLDIQSKPGTKKKFSGRIHWVYGTLWGVVRGLLGITGINSLTATGMHCAAITGAAMAVAPLEGQEPVNKWSAKDIAVDIIHHAVYSLAAGAVFDLIFNSED